MILLAGVFLIAIYCAGSNGELGSAAVGAVVVVLLLAIRGASREQDRAYGNFVDYWASGGPRSYRSRKRGR